MKTELNAKMARGAEPAKSLSQVLGQSEQVKDLVEECAQDLSSVNVALKQELGKRDPAAGVESALEKSEAVEDKVQEASEKLSAVNQALEGEVKERHVLEDQLAAVTEKEAATHHAAFHDPLTDLPNRALFNDRLEHGLAQATRHGWTLAVMFMDLDDFKIINDTHGHDAGDRVLQAIAGRLRENTRGDDTVSRLGGDEFVYLLMEIQSEQDIKSIAEKILKATRAPIALRVGNGNITLSVNASIGISIFPQDGATAAALMKSADEAMYQAKRSKAGYCLAG